MTATTPVVEASARFLAVANRLPTLFDLEDSAYQLLALLDDDPDNAEVEAQLALIDQLLIEKTESYVSVIRSLEAMSAARKAEADRLKDRAATAQKHADWLKARLLAHMKTVGRERVEMARFTLSVRANPPAVQIVDPALVPHEYERTRIEVTVDKRAILEHLKATGEVVPGVEITRGERLSIS